MNSFDEKKSILESPNKSFLRKKWEKTLKDTIIKRIPNVFINNNLITFINSEKQINDLINPINSEKNKKIKIVVILTPLNNFTHLVGFLDKLDKILNEETKIIINYYSKSWKPIFSFFSFFRLINNYKESVYFSKGTFNNVFLKSTNYEISTQLSDISLPFKIPFITQFLSIMINIFPFLSLFSFAKIYYLRKRSKTENGKKLMSLIIPCRNEEGNISKIVKESKEKIFFPYQIVFIDDCSSDQTNKNMILENEKNKEVNMKIINGKGEGKSRAVNLGVRNADGYYCAILDADLTVRMEDLNLFYSAISIGNGDLINGSRLIYKPQRGSMKLLNYFGNQFFAKLVTLISSTKITDTLCGTKCFRKSDWEVFEEFRMINNFKDIWGDFNIIFSAVYYGYKLVDLPVRYYERVSGETKMKRRFFYFLNMLSICISAYRIFKFNFIKSKL